MSPEDQEQAAEGQEKFNAYTKIPAGGEAAATPGVPHDYADKTTLPPEALKDAVPKPSVGRIVHFYTGDTSKQFNGQGAGPYPALVTQSDPGGAYINLKVLPPFGAPFDAGSVSHSDYALAQGWTTYWQWPPRS